MKEGCCNLFAPISAEDATDIIQEGFMMGSDIEAYEERMDARFRCTWFESMQRRESKRSEDSETAKKKLRMVCDAMSNRTRKIEAAQENLEKRERDLAESRVASVEKYKAVDRALTEREKSVNLNTAVLEEWEKSLKEYEGRLRAIALRQRMERPPVTPPFSPGEDSMDGNDIGLCGLCAACGIVKSKWYIDSALHRFCPECSRGGRFCPECQKNKRMVELK